MRLYFFPVAPNPTRVRLYLAEKALAGAAPLLLEQISVNLREGEQRKPEHLARNPLGKVPVLELDDGSFLTESLAIIQYLEELVPEPSLFGESAQERARCRELERIAEIGVLFPVARIVHTTRSPLGLPPDPAVAQYFRNTLPDGLRVLERALCDGRAFLLGDRVSVADCTLAAAFQFARFGGVEIAPEFPTLLRWDARFRARPTAQAVLVL